MKMVIQRVSEACVRVEGEVTGQIEQGLLLLIGFGAEDHDTMDEAQLQKIAVKVLKLRCFSDEEGKMNRSVLDVGGKILAVSQFTLLGNLRKGNRPSFGKAMSPEEASALFDKFCAILGENVNVQRGVFGGDMKVSLLNDGPVTFIVDSKEMLGPRK